MSKFNVILILFVFVTSLQSKEKSINPERVINNLHQLYSKYRTYGDEVQVKGPLFRNGKLKLARHYFKVPLASFEKSKEMAKNVFKLRTNQFFDSQKHEFNSSSVHIGNGFFLTNLHNFSIKMKSMPRCMGAKVTTRAFGKRAQVYSCKKVHYCSKSADFCLFSAKPFGRRNERLSDLPLLQMNTNPIMGKNEVLTAIGNPMDFGMHASSGKGFSSANSFFNYFYAPVFKGNSGGAVFNESGSLVGIVRGRSPKVFSNKSFSISIKMSVIKSLLFRNLPNLREELSKLNWN